MASINVIKVDVLDNPSMFKSDFKFEITFECIAALKDGEGRHGWSAQTRFTRVVLRHPVPGRTWRGARVQDVCAAGCFA